MKRILFSLAAACWLAAPVLAQTTGSVETQVWDDRNANKTRQGNEPGIAGVSVELYSQSGTLVATSSTLANGKAIFSGVAAGNYYLRYSLPTDYKFTPKANGLLTDNNSDAKTNASVLGRTDVFAVTAGQTQKNIDAGMWSPGSITTRVFDDQNANKTRQGNEPGISGVTVSLYDANDVFLTSTVTNANGDATLSPVPADRGVYLKYDVPADHRLTHKASSLSSDNNSDAKTNASVYGKTDVFSLAKGNEHITYVDAGMWTPGSITTRVFDDRNANKTRQGNEPGISGVTVSLYDNANNLLATTTTNANGDAMLSPVPADRSVYLKYDVPADHRLTHKASGLSDDNNSDAKTNASVYGKTDAFSLVKGNEHITYVDAGMWTPGSITTRVFDDRNANKTRQGNEPGLEGISVTLYDNANTELSTATTNSNGDATFNNVPADRGVYLKYDVPADHRLTHKASGLSNDNNSDAKTNASVYGKTDVFSLVKGNEHITYVDAGMWTPGVVKANVWMDANANGTKQGNEESVWGFEVQMFETNGNPVLYPAGHKKSGDPVVGYTSCGNGIAELYMPADRSVYLKFAEAGASFTSKGSLASNNNSDAKTSASALGKTDAFSVDRGNKTIDYVDAGITSRTNVVTDASITTFVWDDRNNNGDHNGEGNKGVEGVKVRLVDMNGNTCTCATTGSNGQATLPASSTLESKYRLKFDLKDDHKFSKKKGSLTSTNNNDANSSGLTGKFSISAGQNINYIEAGVWVPGSLETFVFDDRNKNGDHNGEGNHGVEGITVTLVEKDGVTPVTYPSWHANSGNPVAVATTGSNGKASIDYIPADRQVRLQYGILDGTVMGPKKSSISNTSNNDANSNGLTGKFRMQKGSEFIQYVEAGVLMPGSLETFVFDDRNDNGDHNGEGNHGISGVTVTLVDANTLAVVNYPSWHTNAGNPVATETTGSNGKASFDYVPSDRNVRLKFDLPADYRFGPKKGSIKTTNNNDINSNGLSGKFKAERGSEFIQYVECGMIAPGTLTTFVFDDVNGNRDHNGEGNKGVAGVTVNLVEKNSPHTILATTTTGSNGKATFSYVPSDRQFRLTYELPYGYSFAGKTGSITTTNNSDANHNGMTGKFRIERGSEHIEYVECGVFAPSTLKTFVWEDVNANGNHNGEGNKGVDGVTVTLYDNSGVVLDDMGNPVTAVTGSNGQAILGFVPASKNLRVKYEQTGAVFTTRNANGTNITNTSNSDVYPSGNKEGFTGWFSLNRGTHQVEYVEAGMTTVGTNCATLSANAISGTKKGQARWRNLRSSTAGWDVGAGSDVGGNASLYDNADFGNVWNMGTANAISMTYDAATQTLSTTTTHSTGTATTSYNVGNVGSVDYMKIYMRALSNSTQTVSFNNISLTVNGNTCALGDITVTDASTNQYISMDLTNGFTLSGDLVFTGDAKGQEHSKLDIEFGMSSASKNGSESSFIAVNPVSEMKLFPNPAGLITNVQYTLDSEQKVDMAIYSPTGQLVDVLASGTQVKGSYEVRYDVSTLPAGTYIIRMVTQGAVTTRRLVIAH